jgi:hypothetical protein
LQGQEAANQADAKAEEHANHGELSEAPRKPTPGKEKISLELGASIRGCSATEIAAFWGGTVGAGDPEVTIHTVKLWSAGRGERRGSSNAQTVPALATPNAIGIVPQNRPNLPHRRHCRAGNP